MTAEVPAERLEAAMQHCLRLEAPLAVQLATFAEALRGIDPGFAVVIDRLVERLTRARTGGHAPGLGDRMPSFVLPDEDGRLVALENVLAKGPAVIAFHRGHWCPYCRLSAAALARLSPRVAEVGGQILVITPELQRYNRRLKEDAGASFSVLTDLDSGYALSLDLAFRIDDATVQAMMRRGRTLPEFQGSATWTLPVPATFVVARDGRIVARFVDPDYRRRMAIDDVMAALATLRGDQGSNQST